MKIIKPTKKQVFESLKRYTGCCWLGGHGCQCYSRQLKICFEDEEKRLTKTEYTEEEIKQLRKRNEQAMQDMRKAIDEAFESV